MSLRRLVDIAGATPWSRRRADHEQQNAGLSPIHRDSEDLRSQPLLRNTLPSEQTGEFQRYGSVDGAGPSLEVSLSRRSSPEFRRRESTLNRVAEEQIGAEDAMDDEEVQSEEVEWDLEERGLYPGSYRRVLALYSFVPFVSLLTILFLSFAPDLFWPLEDSKPRPHPYFYPFPFPEVLLSSALWSMAYLLRLPLYSAASSILGSVHPFLTSVLFNVVHAFVFNILRITSLPILGLRQQMQYSRPTWRDLVFRSVWWLSLGWAIVDVIVGIAQSYAQLALYRNVMVPEDRIAEILAPSSADGSRTNLLSSSQEILPLSPRHNPPANGTIPNGENGKSARSGTGNTKSLDEAIRLAVDKDLEQLVNLKEREDLEEIYGFPVIKIPVFISCLQRVDSILLSTGNTLVLSSAYLHSLLSLSVSAAAPAPPSTNRPFLIAFPVVMLMNLTMSLLHTPLILPRIGVHTTAYIGFLLGLGSFFAGLGLWGALA